MEHGRSSPPTGRSGSRLPCRRAGRRTAMAAGRGLLPGDGRGWIALPGDSLRSTTAAGSLGTEFGAGLPARSATGTHTMLRRWSGGSADQGLALVLDSVGWVGALASTSAGSRWVGARPTIRAIAAGAGTAGTTAEVG